MLIYQRVALKCYVHQVKIHGKAIPGIGSRLGSSAWASGRRESAADPHAAAGLASPLSPERFRTVHAKKRGRTRFFFRILRYTYGYRTGYPQVMTNSLLLKMVIEISWIYPFLQWWIFP